MKTMKGTKAMNNFVMNVEAKHLLAHVQSLKSGQDLPASLIPSVFVDVIQRERFENLLQIKDENAYTIYYGIWPWPDVIATFKVQGTEATAHVLRNGMVLVEDGTKYYFHSPYNHQCKHDLDELREYHGIPGIPNPSPYRGYHIYYCKLCGHWHDVDSSD